MAINFAALGGFLSYFVAGIAMLAIFTRLYVWFTPYDEFRDIRNGNVCPAITLAGAMLGFTAPMLVASLYGVNMFDYVQWTIIACVVQLICFKLLYWFMPRQAEDGNLAVALFYAGASVCVGLLNAFSMIPY